MRSFVGTYVTPQDESVEKQDFSTLSSYNFFNNLMLHNLNKLISLFISFCLILEQTAFAQSLDLSRYLANSTKPLLQSDKFRPLHLRYISYDNKSNDFKLLLDKGDFLKSPLKGLSPPAPSKAEGQGTVPDEAEARLKEATQELMKYFFIGLALPNEKFWVNLRPDSPDNILDPDLEKTDIGRIFLEADLQLKKDTSSLTSPQTPEGKAYWDKLYQKAGELYGTENITIPTLTRPWIVPDEIILRESPDTSAYIYKATLKVMLEEDYLKGYQPSAFSSQQSSPNLQPLTSNYNFSDPRLKELNQYSTQLIRETMIPKLTREINSSRRYAPLRQVYYSLILAQHFKKKFINKSGPYSSLMDSRDLTNLTSPEPWDKRTYFKEYQKSFQEGEYNLKASQSTTYGQVIRRYMSGGVELGNGGSSSLIISAKDNRIINHPGILKVSSAILPGDLKALGRPTSSPAVEYVSKSKDLQISDNPKIKRIWGEMVEENLKLYKFAQELTKLTGDYNFINKFPDEDLNNLRVFYNSLNEKDQVYNLGFITFNSGIGKRSGSQLAARFKFNLMFLASMVNAKIEPADIFNKERNNTLLDDKDMEKIASGRKLKEGEELHYLWRHFKAMSDIVWKGVNKNKVDKFFRRFEDLLDIFQQERQSYDEIARVRHAGEKPYMAILKQYQSQIPELINSDSPRQWIERQELVGPITPEGKIGNIGDFPNPRLPGESMGKVRKFRLPDGREVYAKRVNPLRARYPEEEIMISLEVDKSLKKISPYFGVQEFIGIVYDHGAFYLLSLAITGERYSPDKEEANDPYQFKAEVEKILVPLGLGDIEHLFIYKDGNIHCVFLDFETFPYHSAKEENKATEALKSSLSLGSDREVGVRNIVSSATDGDSGELIFKGFEGESKAEILTKVIGSLQKTAKEIEKAGKEMEGVENEQVNIFERYKAFKEEIETNPKLIKEKIEKFGELLDKFSAEVRNIVKNNNNNEEKVFFSEVYVSVFYDLIDKINKARWYPHYIEYGAKVDNFIRVMDAYIKLLSDIQSPEKIEEKYAERMAHRLAESVGEPKLTYRLLKEYNKLPQEEKSSAIPGQIKEAEIEEILKNFPLNNPDWLGGKLKNRIAEDYGRLSVLEPIIADQYGQSNDFLRLPDETMDNLKAQFKEKANEYFYLPIITKHWIKVLTYQYWVNSYNYKVIIAKKSALEKSLNYTYRDIVEGNDDILLLWEFTLRSENNPPTIILEQQGLYKGLRRQGFISEAYPLFVQGLAEKFPGWQVEGEFENPERHENPPALVLFKNYFLDPQPLDARKDEVPDYTEPAIWKARIPPFNPPSSPVNNPGGIDLSALPVTIQSALNQPLTANMPMAGSALNLNLNLDKELRDIQDMLNAGIMPASERIREYALASSSLKPEDHSREIDRLLGCIADIFRLEEEKAKPTPQALKDALILLESDLAA